MPSSTALTPTSDPLARPDAPTEPPAGCGFTTKYCLAGARWEMDEDLASPSRQTGIRNIELPVEYFTQLAKGDGSAEVVRLLRTTELSRRMMVLFKAFTWMAGEPSIIDPLPPVDASWEALEKAYKAWPERVGGLLSHPQVGNWLAYLDRL